MPFNILTIAQIAFSKFQQLNLLTSVPNNSLPV